MSAKSSDQSRNSSPSEANVSAIMSIEREAVAARSIGERLGDVIARQAGRLWFIVAHLIWFGVWVLLNAGLIPSLGAFDRYPYQFLNFVVSLEAIFLSLFYRGSRGLFTPVTNETEAYPHSPSSRLLTPGSLNGAPDVAHVDIR